MSNTTTAPIEEYRGKYRGYLIVITNEDRRVYAPGNNESPIDVSRYYNGWHQVKQEIGFAQKWIDRCFPITAATAKFALNRAIDIWTTISNNPERLGTVYHLAVGMKVYMDTLPDDRVLDHYFSGLIRSNFIGKNEDL